ncbi:plastid terminal oxidase [Nannochloropsis oceanica]
MSREAALEKWRTFVNDNLNDAGQNVRVSVRLADAMFDCGSVQSGKAGTFLIEEGSDEEDQAEKTEKRRAARQEREIFFLLDGQVRIQVRGQKVARLNQGDFLGEASFVTNRTGPRSVTAICSGETGAHYIVWNQAKLHAFLEGGKQGGKEGGGKVDAHASLSGQDHTLNELRNALTELWVRQLSKKLALTMATYERGWQPTDELEADERKYEGDFGFRNSSAFGISGPADELSKSVGTSSPYMDAVAVIRKLIIGAFGAIDLTLEWFGIFPTLRPSRAYMSENQQVVDLQARLRLLTLSNEAISKREETRREIQIELIDQAQAQGVGMAAKMKQSGTPWFVILPYYALCAFLDIVYEGRPLARFWFLETVARMPYFSYISMLHLYETLGWWTIGTDVRRVHFAEEWNELHHLQIMESLGGDARWLDRFLARHSAILYYWVLNVFFLVSPRLAYNFSELIESHAVDTYSQFLEENEELLKKLPAPRVALDYYVMGDLYMFDEFQTSRPVRSRRPLIRSLYDVFSAIRDDESEHVKTINACQVSEEKIISPNAAAANAGWAEQVEEEDEEKMERRLREDWVREYDALGVGRPWDGGEEVGAEEGEEGEDHDGLGWSEEVEFP